MSSHLSIDSQQEAIMHEADVALHAIDFSITTHHLQFRRPLRVLPHGGASRAVSADDVGSPRLH